MKTILKSSFLATGLLTVLAIAAVSLSSFVLLDKPPGKISFSTKNDKHGVTGEFKKWKVTEYKLPGNKIEKVKTTIEVDITSISTGMEKLDAHLLQEEFFDATNHPKMIIKINGAKKAGKKYTTNAKLTMKGKEEEIPFEFEVIQKSPLKIKGTGVYKRALHGIGKAEGYYGLIPEVNFNVEATMPK